jgi:IS30 family transposase
MRDTQGFSGAERTEIWDRISAGVSIRSTAKALESNHTAIRRLLETTGGVRPAMRRRSGRHLSLDEREEISRGLAAGQSLQTIAKRLHRAPSTVSREVRRNGGLGHYRAWAADRRADHQAYRPKVAKLARSPRLRRVVEARLRRRWSPEQISRWLAGHYPDDPEMRVSHETIYLSLYVQGRGALRKELHRALRTGRALRRPKAKLPTGQGHLKNMVLISERPAEVEDRAVPGHWEGDLIMGRGAQSCIGTLVERSTRYVLLMKLEQNTAEQVRAAMTKKIRAMPGELKRSVTWDRGKEMAEHVQFTVATGVQVYFCDPSSPWQRGTNENTNGLLRQYFPKGSDLSVHSQAELNAVARELNGRPRQTLGWVPPSQRLAEVVASTG